MSKKPQAVINGKLVPLDAEALKALAFNAMQLAAPRKRR